MLAIVGLLAQAGNEGADLDITSILGYIVIGAIVGVVARFLVPGDDPMGIIGTIVLGIVGASLHLGRTVCRRAERSVVALGADAVPAIAVVYLNRLSDLLFVLARVVNQRAQIPETTWQP